MPWYSKSIDQDGKLSTWAKGIYSPPQKISVLDNAQVASRGPISSTIYAQISL